MRRIKEVTLTSSDVQKYLSAQKMANELYQPVIKRIDDVFYAILQAFGITKPSHMSWWFHDGSDDGNTTGQLTIIKDTVCGYDLESEAVNLLTAECNYYEQFPVKFLYMSRKEIISHIRSEMTDKDRFLVLSDSQQKAIMKAAANKLSAVEKVALGID